MQLQWCIAQIAIEFGKGGGGFGADSVQYSAVQSTALHKLQLDLTEEEEEVLLMQGGGADAAESSFDQYELQLLPAVHFKVSQSTASRIFFWSI